MKNKQIFFFVFSFILFGINFLSFQLSAQSIPPIHFSHYTTDDGLPHDIGYQMMEDNQGYLWIGTDNGLARFDGNKFKVYGDEKGLTNPYAIDLTIPNGKDFFIASWGNGIFKKTKDSIVHLPLDLRSPKIARLNSIDPNFLQIWTKIGFTEFGAHTFNQSKYDLIRKKLERVLFYEKNGRIYKSVEEKIEFQEDLLKKSNLVELILKDDLVWNINPSIKTSKQEEIYLTDKGIFKITPNAPVVSSVKPYTVRPELPNEIWQTKFTKELEPFDERLKGIPFTSFLEDPTGGYWLGGNGKFCYLGVDGSLETYPAPTVKSSPGDMKIWQKKYLTFYVYEDRSKLYLLDINTKQIYEVMSELELSANISDIFIDREQNLWITTDGSGLYCLKPFLTRNFAKEEGLGNTFIYDLVEGNNGIICAATKNGLYTYSKDNWERIDHPLLNLDLYGGIEKTKNGDLLLGSGLNSSKVFELEIPAQEINNIKNGYLGRNFYLDPKNRIWSIKVFDEFYQLYKTNRIEKLKSIYKERNWGQGFSHKFLKKYFDIQEIRNDHFTALEINDTTLLMGTSRGLFEVIGDSLKHFSKEDGLPSTVVHDIVKSEDGSIWIATENGICIKEENEFLKISTEGLISLQARKLLFDHHGRLWVGTPAGLHYFIFSEATWFPITKNMGLIANDVTAVLEDSKSRLWIGTSRGITMLPNQEPLKKLPPPQVSIEKAMVNNQLNASLEAITKIPFRSTLQVEYTALSFQAAKELLFRYRLNVGDPWQTTKSRSISLFDLADGNYNLQIQARKPNSDWSKPKTFSFTVKPPWYRSLWFLIFTAFVLFGIAQFFFLYKIRSERKKIEAEAQLKEEMAHLEMKALQAQMNPHFIFNAMNSIMEFVMNEDKYSANQYLSKFSKLMRLFLDASKSNYISLGEELELINLYVELEKLRFKDKFDFEITHREDLPIDTLEIPSILVQPFIENAIHHGLHLKKEKGKLAVRIKLIEQKLIIEIEDNGVGRAAALEAKKLSLKTYKSRGTQIVQEKITLLNTRQDDHYSVKTLDLMDPSGRPCGTKVVINISILD